ncbi:hypothetical protein [Hyalangium gracile]|uniref:hypothetical protein n=1 Tax=Hyalangium gracile TaxID=394092 RepID=UPI001CCB802B|nr:hypothetical protein [Hyalangium gracile]
MLLSWRRIPAARAFFERLGLPSYLWLHMLRAFIGAGFLIELSRGRLPAEFALGAGVGDIIAGLLAALVLFTPARTPLRARALWVFNVVGFVDILAVLVAAQRILFFGDPRAMASFGQAPWPMVPLYVVPLIVASHVILFARLKRPASLV